jgi:hypothetical protein
MEKAKGIVIAPLWPTQPRFTRLLEFLIDNPIIIPKTKNLLKIPHQDKKHPLQETLVLIACLVSGNCIENEVFSKQTVNIIMSSWKLGTKKQYWMFTKRWFQYCSEEQVNSVRPTLDNILEFLTSLFDKGLGYSSLNTIRGALSALGIKCDGHLVGSHPLVVRYMKGVYNLRPTLARYTHIWDVSKVLSYLRKLSPVKYIILKDLTLKLCMLIALTCATRTQSIHLLSVNNVHKLSSEFVIEIEGLLKQSRPGYRNPFKSLPSR